MQTKNRNRGDKQQRFLLLFLFYIRQVFYAIGRKAATCLSIRQQVISKQLVAFLFISVLAFVNLAAVEARTVTIDLDQLRTGNPSDGWVLSNEVEIWLQDDVPEVDTYIIKGSATGYSLTIRAKGKKCIFQGNVTLTEIVVESSDFTFVVQNKLTVGNIPDCKGIYISRASKLTIEGPGILDVTATGKCRPGIGGGIGNYPNEATSYGTLIIKS